jgi:membrane associated rhomboid family serine protease
MTLNPISGEPQFRQCPVCGDLAPADAAACPHCGAVYSEVEKAARQAATEYSFLSALFTRSNPFTMIFIGINVGVFILMCLAGGFTVTSTDHQVLIGFGAKENSLIANQHQYWRLISAIFIHIGFIHLFLNNYALWIIGQEIEQIYGSARFVVLYLVTGLIGSLGSYAFSPEPSAGASGAIFGLFGVMATFAFKYRKEIPETLSREIRRRVLPVIAINLVFGFSMRGIVDNYAHIGGLLGGVALALAVPYMRPDEKRAPIAWRALQTICLVVIFVSFVAAFRNYDGPSLALSNLTRKRVPSVVPYFNRMKEGNQLLGESFGLVMTALENRNEVGELRGAIDAIDRGISTVNSVPAAEPEADQYRARLLDLLTQQKNILNEVVQSSTPNKRIKLTEVESNLLRQHHQFVSDYSKWLPGFLKKYGYQLEEGPDR